MKKNDPVTIDTDFGGIDGGSSSIDTDPIWRGGGHAITDGVVNGAQGEIKVN